ncbi:hypothetical protein JCM10213_005465 [Rhodosporidiobolus nylandii]
MLYLTSEHFSFFLPLGLIGVFRYLWFCIRLLAAFCYKPIPIPDEPTYTAIEDVTIIVPTIDSDSHFLTAMRSWLAGQPFEIIIITAENVLPALQAFADEINAEDAAANPDMVLGRDGAGRVRVYSVEKPNKRVQMSEGIRKTVTDIIIFADDDSLWPPTLMPLVLACFEDPQIGGVGTSQVVLPQSSSGKFTVWETLAAFRLSIRNIEIAASTHLDGGVPCLSGRTAAYRTMILKDPAFLWGFTNDFWRGKYHLNSGDDKFLTRWLVSHGWRTYIQVCAGAELKSTMKADWTFLKQVLRWTRNTWRSDLRSIFMERHVWRRHPYIAYTMIDKFLNPITLLAGPALVIYLCARSAKGEALPAFLDPTGSSTSSSGEVYVLPTWNILVSWFVWLTVTRTLKLAPHLVKRPQDIIYVPVWAVFGYCFSIVKIYALLTLHEVGWGTRAGVDSTPSSSSSSAPPAAVEEEKRASPLASYRSAAAPPSLQHDRDRDPTPDAAYPSSAPMVTLDNMTSYRLSVSSDPFDDARRAVNDEWHENEERVEGWAEDLETREVEGYEQAGLTPMIRAVEREERGVR